MEYFICILPIALCLLIICDIWLIICDIIDDRRTDRRYQEYIDSIKVGDIFVPNFIEDLDNDPFDEKDYSSEYSKVIVDIKKNNKGETWVKYKRLNCDVEFTQEIHRFVKDHKIVTSNLKSDGVCCPKNEEI